MTLLPGQVPGWVSSSFKSLSREWQKSPLVEARARAWQVFEDKGFPSSASEDWRYTNLIPLLGQSYECRCPGKKECTPLVNRADLLKDVGLFFANGLVAQESKLEEMWPEGVEVYSLADVLADANHKA